MRQKKNLYVVLQLGIIGGILEKEVSFPLIIAKYVHHCFMKDASHCIKTKEMKCSFAAVIAMGSDTPSKVREKN